ncbi:MAG: GNAT family N-acetyltransferase [Armatimonadota bacterium]
MDLWIRAFTDLDIEFALAQTTRARWDSTREMFRVCLRHDPEGCFVAEIGGERVGMITTMRHERSAWVGNLIVTPDFRRRGIGERVVGHVVRRLGAGGIRTFWLEADPMVRG